VGKERHESGQGGNVEGASLDAARPSSREEARARRAAILSARFPSGVPRLWCPPLTHYRADGGIDHDRMAAHLGFVTQWSKGLLVPGSTGDGWELSLKERREVTDLALAEARRLDARVLVGALHPDSEAAAGVIRDGRSRLKGTEVEESVCGFAVCPPRGSRLSQDEIRSALEGLLELGSPLALYQLPQMTRNEMSPELVADLVGRFANALFFKDSSGHDLVATAQLDLAGLYLVRGAEGDYAEHLKANGGTYDGLLLSTANSFGKELTEIIELSERGRSEEARELSARLSQLVAGVFDLVRGLPEGNAFANAGKAFDHYFAYGPQAAESGSPRLHGGRPLPAEIVRATGKALSDHGFMPERGYLS
jgi:dihydrodipicolinate synthase/N-acetylneuraminate lyase